jgi:hypothetical protein
MWLNRLVKEKVYLILIIITLPNLVFPAVWSVKKSIKK